jgi:hypothetical protein
MFAIFLLIISGGGLIIGLIFKKRDLTVGSFAAFVPAVLFMLCFVAYYVLKGIFDGR